MADPKLEEVFKLSGIPVHNFVKPGELYKKLLVSLRTRARGLVVEGPSGIGKTTSITKALEELDLSSSVLKLTARKQDDRELITELPRMQNIGTVIIDDFHRLDEDIKRSIADYMKRLADEEDGLSKLVIVGINKAGDTLVRFASDLNNRIDTIKFEANPDPLVNDLVVKGEQALNISINTRDEIVKESRGSFHIAQFLCHWTCLISDITEKSESYIELNTSFEVVKERVFAELSRLYFDFAQDFATGPRYRPEGRAPYLHILRWLSESDDWSISLDQAFAQHPSQRGSVGQVVDKGYLNTFIEQKPSFSEFIHFDPTTRIISVEDPKLIYFLRNLLWSKFAKQIGYYSVDFKSRYDFALSFAGSDRHIAEALFNRLRFMEVEVFYDRNEQHRILAENIEEYLAPIYRSEAHFVIVLLGPDYPKRIWTKFESDQFKERFGDAVIPIWFSDTPGYFFDETRRVGGLEYDRSEDLESQIDYITDVLIKKLAEQRLSP